jgi:hypothetical protein
MERVNTHLRLTPESIGKDVRRVLKYEGFCCWMWNIAGSNGFGGIYLTPARYARFPLSKLVERTTVLRVD